MPIVTRLYTPAQIGVISVFLAFFSFWTSLLSWRYESALLIARDDGESHDIFRLGALCVVATSLLAWPTLRLLRGNDIFGFGLLPAWSAWSATPILCGYGLFMLLRMWSLRCGFVRSIAQASLARSASNALIRVALGSLGGGVPALFAAELFGAWGAVGTLYRATRRRFVATQSGVGSWRGLKEVMIRYSRFVKYELPSVAIDSIALAIPVPMLASLYGAEAAGWFGMARLLVAIPNAQVGRAVGDTFQMELARALREHDHAEAHRLFYRLLRLLSLFGLFPLIGFIAGGSLLVPHIFGKSWSEMGWITACIAPWMYASLVVGPLSNLLSVLQAQQYKLIYDIFLAFLMVVVYCLAREFLFSMHATVISLSAGSVMAYAMYLGVLLFVMKNRIGVRSNLQSE
jgi:O-antigen/teichoic acid export membrane protein